MTDNSSGLNWYKRFHDILHSPQYKQREHDIAWGWALGAIAMFGATGIMWGTSGWGTLRWLYVALIALAAVGVFFLYWESFRGNLK